MPFPPSPTTYRCRQCSWRKRVRPTSDALAWGVDCFASCPQCGSDNLQITHHPKSRGPLAWIFGR
ncbi:hypothetical protein BXT89_03735 [Halopseudomonas pachastrellae]|uniref:Uncharacterized protein n=1 Tax=Halopseudomonas pachastrellae TaxID=254161 RepID=A0A1S8DL12_9GAMM|nr:hypothetical protein BXT89_03735 [Halopseudomonas pachastrellae]